MKIKSIYIDGLHNAREKTYTFGDIVYIFGHNGAGKSTVLHAIQFALLGYIPGSAKNSKEAILRHSPCKRISVRLVFDNDVSIERKIDEKSNKLTTMPDGYDISCIISDLELPIFNFNEFVGQTANKLKEYFIKNILPNTDGNLDWEQILTESILDCNFQDRDEIIQYGMSLVQDLEGEILEQVIAANQKFKSEQSFNKTELQRLQNTVDSLIYYDDYAGPTNLDDLTSQILELGAIRDQLMKYESVAKATQSAQDELVHISDQLETLGGRERYDNATKTYPQLQKACDKYVAEIEKKKSAITTLRANISSIESVINSKGVCTYTKEPCKSILTKIDNLRNDLVTKKAEIVELETQLEKLNTDCMKYKTAMSKCETLLHQFNTIWDRMAVLQKTMGELPEKPDTDKSVMELNAELELLNVSKTKLMANIKYNETIENITKMKFEAELQGKALACWVKKTDTNGLQTTLMVRPFEELATVMTGYIQQMYGCNDIQAHFNISTKANSFSFGLIRDSVYIPYDLLSSGEKCLYTLALMMCIVKNSKSSLKILLCDDMFDHLDSFAIENTFKALKEIKDIQFIFAGVKECQNAEDIMLRIE